MSAPEKTRDAVTRRRFFTKAGAAAAAVAAAARVRAAQQLPNEQPPWNGPEGQTPRYSKTELWVQITTGGKPYPASFMDMFLDPVFLGMEMWPIDQPTTFAALMPPAPPGARGGGGGRGAAQPSQEKVTPLNGAPGPGAGSVGGGTERLEPADYPWEPSGGRPHPGYDVLLLNDQMDWPENLQTQAKQAVESGRGVVVIHHALGDNQTWPWWYQEVTGGLLVLADRPGMKKSIVGPATRLAVRPVGTHPIVRGLEPFTLAGEPTYKGMWQSPKITPLLETTATTNDRTVAWAGVHPAAKVVCIQPGASRETHRHASYRMLVRNAILWAGGRLI
jgi:hypothetical protein